MTMMLDTYTATAAAVADLEPDGRQSIEYQRGYLDAVEQAEKLVLRFGREPQFLVVDGSGRTVEDNARHIAEQMRLTEAQRALLISELVHALLPAAIHHPGELARAFALIEALRSVR